MDNQQQLPDGLTLMTTLIILLPRYMPATLGSLPPKRCNRERASWRLSLLWDGARTFSSEYHSSMLGTKIAHGQLL
jgi:hypothetical protein